MVIIFFCRAYNKEREKTRITKTIFAPYAAITENSESGLIKTVGIRVIKASGTNFMA